MPPRPQRRQETIASMLVLIWTHVGPTSPSPKIARQGYGGRLPLSQLMNGPKAMMSSRRKGDMLTLRFRDYPRLPKFFRHRTAVALMSPASAQA